MPYHHDEAVGSRNHLIIFVIAVLQDKLEKWKDTKPDLEPAFDIKKKIRTLKSKLRHKLVDRDDMKEVK